MSFYWYTLFLENEQEQIQNKYGNQELEIKAVVISSPEQKEYKNTYKIKVVKIGQDNKTFKLLCHIKKDKKSSELLKYGDEIQFTAKYEVPDIARNEGGFDYKKYLKTKDIKGIVTVTQNEIIKTAENREASIKTKIHNFKINLIQKIKKTLHNEVAGVCIGLLLGDKVEILPEIQNSFRQSSLSHMLAISGAHVSYLLLGLGTFLNLLKLHKRWSKLVIILFLIFFMVLIDFTPSVTRACIMCILTLLAEITFQKSDTYQNLAISNFIILLFNPYALLDIGFQLSFGGTIGILFFVNQHQAKSKNKLLQYIKQTLKVSIAANLILFPIIIYHFNTVSATFLISNLLATPILGISIILGMFFILALIIYTPIANIVSYFLTPILQFLIQIAKWTSQIPLSQILLPTPKIWQIIIYYSMLFLIFKYNFKCKDTLLYQKRKIIYMVLICILMLPYFKGYIPASYTKISCIDVGQGDSFFIQTPSKKTILIDGGGADVGNFDVGEKTLLPYLLKKGIMKIDYILVSHLDTDHCAGLFTILEKLKVSQIIISKQGKMSNNFKQLIDIIKKKKINVIVVKAADKIQIDKNCYFDILFPQDKLIMQNVLNNNSIVAKFCIQNNKKEEIASMLFTGDIEKIAEEQILQMYTSVNKLESTILKVAHHGSKTSSIEPLLQVVKPKIAFIRSGKKQ